MSIKIFFSIGTPPRFHRPATSIAYFSNTFPIKIFFSIGTPPRFHRPATSIAYFSNKNIFFNRYPTPFSSSGYIDYFFNTFPKIFKKLKKKIIYLFSWKKYFLLRFFHFFQYFSVLFTIHSHISRTVRPNRVKHSAKCSASREEER